MAMRKGVGNTILVALVLALSLAAVLGFIATSTQGDVLGFMSDSSDQTDTTLGSQKSGLKDTIEQGIKEGLEGGGIGGGTGGQNSNMPTTSPGSNIKGAVGGGPEYVAEKNNEFCQPPAGATTVSSKQKFIDAVESAGSGDIVYVSGDAEIDLSQTDTVTAGSGVTLASNRGCNGAEGGLIYNTDYIGRYQIKMGENSRFTGLRLKGPHLEYFNPRDAGCKDGGDVDWYCKDTNGLKITNGEVDNSEVFGWTYAISAGGSTHVHHNHIHHNPYESLGYGVATSSDPLIEYNYFNYNRHSIASTYKTSYEARYNIVGPDWMGHPFDVHGKGNNGHLGGQAGVEVKIHHNTFQAAKYSEKKTRSPGSEGPAIAIRGTPKEGAWINNNWFYHTSESKAIRQKSGDGNMYISDNHYGESTPSSCDIGGPRDGC